MATIDPTIALRAAPSVQLESPLNQLASMLQIQDLGQRSRLNKLQINRTESELQETNQLAKFLQGGVDLTSPEGQAGLYRAAPMKATEILKGVFDARKARTGADQADFDLAQKRYSQFRQTMGALSIAPDLSKDMVVQAGQDLVQAGILPMEKFEASMGRMPDDPVALRAALRQTMASQLNPEQVFKLFVPQATQVDNGQQISFRDTNPNSPTFGQNVAGPQIQRQQTPESVASNATSRRGQDLVNARAKEANDIAAGAVVSKRVQDTELKLQDDYRTESKGFAETSTAMKKILGAIETADKNPGSALSAGTAFMKLLDPNSVVRESELGMALNASGWFDRATNIANTLQSGRIMTATQKQNLKSAAETLFEEAKAAQREVDAAFDKRARAYGADPARVIVDRGQRARAASTGSPSLASAIDAELARRGNEAR